MKKSTLMKLLLPKNILCTISHEFLIFSDFSSWIKNVAFYFSKHESLLWPLAAWIRVKACFNSCFILKIFLSKSIIFKLISFTVFCQNVCHFICSVLFRLVPYVLFRKKERSILFRSFLEFLATYETQKNVPFFSVLF